MIHETLLNKNKKIMKTKNYLLVAIVSIVLATNLTFGQIETQITGADTSCIGQNTPYSASVTILPNKYLFRDTVSTGNLGLGYNSNIITNTFSYDIWVKPTRSITMTSESNACAGDVSVPLANSNQNWAFTPSIGDAGNMGTGLTIGTNGLMIAEHSTNILVSRLSYTTSITDWVHVAIVYRTDSIFLYLNGNLVSSRQIPCSGNLRYVSGNISGARYSPEFQGNIDEFRLWDIALTPQQVAYIKDKKFMNQVSGLRYYASFDNGKFERTLGDIGTDSMLVNGLSNIKNIKTNTWTLSPYQGTNINSLTPFSLNNFTYQWSNGKTTNSITYAPTDTINYLKVKISNGTFTKMDSIKIVGLHCCKYYYYDTIKTTIYDTVKITTPVINPNTRYIRFDSYYSGDDGQVDVYEIQAYSIGANVALNKLTKISSGNGGASAVDGNDDSRWESDRSTWMPDSLHPQYIVIDLQKVYSVDSFRLNISGFDNWKQSFGLFTSTDSVNWNLIGSGVRKTGIFIYKTTNSNTQTIYDTIKISVTDTLFIKVNLTGISSINSNTLKVYPNPTKNHLTINYGNYSNMSGYTLKITNSLGQQVFMTPINQQQSYLNLSDWGGKGIYYISIIDRSNKTIENKKIVLQ